ncbi:helix-turn-helix domain-containing protein [Halocatena pleomorpha]|uniref:Uncharacterized protein n=1 Tax=Halocatena pleomorpha TaxID=1785090 RepID=A0A3P3R5Q7_9EURY|nr:hypothetical protein [Halocatena pleomorpha]RRJ28797.1 hypothetical protein EIK79_14845 [Halocatena pleomorpha]
MTTPGEKVEFSEDTELRCASTTIGKTELQRLKQEKVFRDVETDGEIGVVKEVNIDFRNLAQLVYQYDTLDMVASQVRVEILNHFRAEDANKFSTGELVKATGRNDSNVSEALGQLVDEGHLKKIQKGFYALNE